MIVARFHHISCILHRWLGDHDVKFVLVHAWSCDGESRMENRMPAAMTALAQGPFSGAEALVQGTEADGVADAMIEAMIAVRGKRRGSTRLVNKTETVPSGAAKRRARRRSAVCVRRCVGVRWRLKVSEGVSQRTVSSWPLRTKAATAGKVEVAGQRMT